jgi:hypothetical protein
MRLYELINLTIFYPKKTFPLLVSFKIKRSEIFEALLLVSILNTILNYFFINTFQIGPDNNSNLQHSILQIFTTTPFLMLLLQIVNSVLIALVIAYGGKLFSGSGDLFDGLKGVIWINFILVLVSAVQFILMLFTPNLAFLVGVIAAFWSVWCFALYGNSLHGFESIFLTVILGIFLFLAVLVAFTIILSSLGFISFGELYPDV